MKKLSQFLIFDTKGFLEDKVLKVTGIEPWYQYLDGKKTETELGVSIEVVIVKDSTKYNQKPGEIVTNEYEKFKIKVPKEVTVDIGDYIRPVNPVGTVYGEYRNMLSVKSDDIQVKKPQAKA